MQLMPNKEQRDAERRRDGSEKVSDSDLLVNANTGEGISYIVTASVALGVVV